MRITKLISTGLIGTIVAAGVFSCKKDKPFIEIEDVPKYVQHKRNLFQYRTGKVSRDTSYHFYGYDTLEINRDFFANQRKYADFITKEAIKKTPKTEIGKHIEVQMIPKRGGGFDQIFVWEKDYKPDYKDQKVIINSKKVFTRDGDDMYIPVEYYGRINN